MRQWQARGATIVLVLCAWLGCADERPVDDPEVRVFVDAVIVDEQATPVVLLEDRGGDRVLPIWIGTAEATSIAHELNRIQAPRPNTHDMATRVVDVLGSRVERVVVVALEGGTFYGRLTLRGEDGDVVIDVRPSDGIAMALRAGAPVFVRESVLRAAGQSPAEEDEKHSPARRKPTGIPPATSGRSV